MSTKKLRSEIYGTIDEFRADINQIAEKIIAIRKLELARDKKVQEIIAAKNGEIEKLKEEAAVILGKCDLYAKNNRESVFPAGTKTSETELCTFYLRMGAKALKALNSKWNEQATIDACKADPAWKNFVRVKESLDKDAIKAAGFTDADLAFKGLRLTQTERLTVEPKVNSL